MNSVIKLIQGEDWKPILDLIENLNERDRIEMTEFLSGINVEDLILEKFKDDSSLKMEERRARREKYYRNRKRLYALFQFATLTCIRTKKDINSKIEGHLVSLVRNPKIVLDGIIQFYKKHPPDYLDAFYGKHKNGEFFSPDFHLIWLLYENDWISFDEEFFVNSLLVVLMFDRNTVDDANFLMQHPKALEQVFLQFYKHETPILDISKWQGKDEYKCAKVTNYWTEVLDIIQENGIEIPRKIVSDLLSTLVYNWKKPHINWHISILKKLKPTKQEYLDKQDYLFAAISSENNTIANYVIAVVKSIYKLKGFDAETFLSNLDTIYVKEKMDKSILVSLGIVDHFLENNEEYQASFSENLALGLMQVNASTQAAFAKILAKYTSEDELSNIVEPYTSILKNEAKQILNIQETTAISLPEIIEKELVELKIPENWTDLLYHIGLCIKTKSAANIEVFFEALNQLQDQIPDDFKKQIKPFTKRLFNTHWEHNSMTNFSEFFWNWVEGNIKYVIEDKWRKQEKVLPFLRHKCILLFNKLQKKDTLPFLSTPTHEPFYVNPDILIDKLLIYEKAQSKVDLDDLIIATNRILQIDISEKTITKAKRLQGDYKEAILYLLGITNKIQIQEDLLPLWAQIARTKNPDKIHEEFSEYSIAKHTSVIKPFYINYKIEKDKYWCRLTLNKNWNGLRWGRDESKGTFKKNYTYTAPFELAHREDIYYQMSFLAHYIDPLLCRYIPDTGSGNEVGELEQCLYPLQYLLEHQLIVRHSGWIYIAQCLIFEKRISRDLAREYIMFSLANKTMNQDYFTDVVADMIIKNYAPVKRLTESFDETENPTEVKELYYLMASKCIQLFKPRNKPRSYKKIIESYRELQKELVLPIDDKIELIIKTLK